MESEIPTIDEDAEVCTDEQSQPIINAAEVPEAAPCGNCSTLKLKIRRYQQNIYKLKMKKQQLKDQISKFFVQYIN